MDKPFNELQPNEEVVEVIVDFRDAKTDKVVSYQIDPDKTLRETERAVGNCLKITLRVKDSDLIQNVGTNAFDQLMQVNTRLILPKKMPEIDGKACLFNQIIELLKVKGLGFNSFQENEKSLFMKTMLSTLWLLDGQHHKFHAVGTRCKIPDMFLFTPPEDRATFRVLTHEQRVKKNVPRLKRDVLIETIQQLELLISKSFLKSDLWTEMYSNIVSLKHSIEQYVKYLFDATEINSQTEEESSGNPTLYKKEAMKNISHFNQTVYKKLKSDLLSVDTYTPMNIIFYAPIDRRRRYDFVQSLQFDFDIHVYKLHQPHAVFVWRLPVKDEQSEARLAATVAKLQDNIKCTIKKDRLKKMVDSFSDSMDWSQKKVQKIVAELKGML